MKTMKQISKKAMLILALVTTTVSFAQMKPMDGSKIVMSKYSFSETVDMVKSVKEYQRIATFIMFVSLVLIVKIKNV